MTEWNELRLPYQLQWFAKDGPGGEKTEEPTAKRLTDARKDGKVAKSKELNSAFDLIVLFLLLKIFISYLYDGFLNVFRYTYTKIPEYVEQNAKEMNGYGTSSFLLPVMLELLQLVLPFFLFGLVVAVLISILQVGWKITTKPMKPKLDKFNILNGFKRILSKDSLFELFKSIVKIVDTGFKIAVVYLIIGAADWAYQKHKFHEEMKMTKQEVKDEYKNTEGSPEVKSKQRQKMQEASRRRMMQDVPKADVIITNPTHISVALHYDSNEAKAPVVLAKGEDYLALKIREVAKEHQIEIVENKPLARMLYANVDIGQEIPPELYQAVAEVLAMVYNLKNN